MESFEPPPALKRDGRATHIYALHDPTEVSQRVYVGMTVHAPEKRRDQHIVASAIASQSLRSKWLSSMVERGVVPAVVVLENVPAGGDYQEAERFWIGSLRAIGVSLANGTDGGHGARGLVVGEETRRRLSMAHSGRRHTPEAIAKISTAKKGIRKTTEHRKKLGAAHRGVAETEGAKRSMSAAKGRLLVRSQTGFKGVKAMPDGGFTARIGHRHIGYFKAAEDAASAYDSAARAKWGLGAALNFPRPGEKSARPALNGGQ